MDRLRVPRDWRLRLLILIVLCTEFAGMLLDSLPIVLASVAALTLIAAAMLRRRSKIADN